MTPSFTCTSAWDVTVYEANISLNGTIAMAQTLVDTPSEQSWVATEAAPYIDYNVTGGVLHFPSMERTLPGTTMGIETDNFAVTATGMLVIPAAGTYTFGVDSDDGFNLTITGDYFHLGYERDQLQRHQFAAIQWLPRSGRHLGCGHVRQCR